MTALCAALEEHGQEGELEKAVPLVEILHQEFERVKAALAALI